MDVRSGWPKKVSFNYDLLSANGSPVRTYCTYPTNRRENITSNWTLYPKALGTETVTFQLVHESNGRYYNTAFQTVAVPVVVICSHAFGEGVLIQEATDTQNDIMEYTCKYCGEKKTLEFDEPGVMLTTANFPDAKFLSFIKSNYDKNGLGRLSDSDIAAITEMDCSNKSIASLKGIEYFTALEKLRCYSNRLTSLDISKNAALSSLICYSNQLTILDISGCSALGRLECEGNMLTSLNISACPKLLTAVNNGSMTSGDGYIKYTSSDNSLKCDQNVTIIRVAPLPAPDLILPASLTVIGEEAFAGGAFAFVRLPETAVSIGWHAFADCPNLAYVYIPRATTDIDPYAFGVKCDGLTIVGTPDSTAESFARIHGFSFVPAV